MKLALASLIVLAGLLGNARAQTVSTGPTRCGDIATPLRTLSPTDNLLLTLNGPVKLCAVQVTATQTGYLMLFDATTKPPDGTVSPLAVFFYSAVDNKTVQQNFDPPIRLTNGGILVFSTTGPYTLTASNAAFISAEVVHAP